LLMSCNGMYAAQESRGAGEQTPGVEVTAYRVPVTLQETAQGVTVIDRQEIEIRKPDSVIELLRQVPGVQIDQVGSPGGVSSIYIRGSDPEQVLVLIDGVRVNDPMLSRGGSYDISSIDPALMRSAVSSTSSRAAVRRKESVSSLAAASVGIATAPCMAA